MEKKILTTQQQIDKYKKKYRITLVAFLVSVLLFGIFVYANYNYLAFKYFITQHYIYTDTLDEMFTTRLRSDVEQKYYRYFDDLVISIVTESIRATNNDRYTYLYIPEHYQRAKELERKEALLSSIAPLDKQIQYMRITNFSDHTQAFVEQNIENLNGYPYLIIDLRDNRGGNIFVMNRIVDFFLPRKSVLSMDTMRIIDWTHKTRKPQTLAYEKIIILQNRNSASASENFIAALKDNLDNVTLIGTPTFGKGIGQYTLPLKRGFAVKATTMLWHTPKGINIHNVGIAPDIYYTDEDIIDFTVQKLITKSQ